MIFNGSAWRNGVFGCLESEMEKYVRILKSY